MRIAIVNDVKLTVEVLKRIISMIPEHEIAWIAYNGAEAVSLCERDLPDLILMDLIMPIMGGVEAIRRIMQTTPCPILVVTSTVAGHASKVYEAMGEGALDAVKTPVVGLQGDRMAAEDLLRKIDTIGTLTGKQTRKVKKAHNPPAQGSDQTAKYPTLLVIGASTGGPLALAQILSNIPPDSKLAIVIVQHVDEEFSGGLARWLGEKSTLPVQIAFQGAVPTAGLVLIAGKSDHLYMSSSLELRYTPDPIDMPYRPSVDVFFKSIAKAWPEPAIAVLLTGMGYDGGQGMKVLRDAGWFTIAQDQETSVVFGMPKAAIDAGGASIVLPLKSIVPNILSYLERKKKG
jgi:two-component system response regulator WspF